MILDSVDFVVWFYVGAAWTFVIVRLVQIWMMYRKDRS